MSRSTQTAALWVYWGEEGVVSGVQRRRIQSLGAVAEKEPEVEAKPMNAGRGRGSRSRRTTNPSTWRTNARRAWKNARKKKRRQSLVAKFDGAGQLLAKGLDNEDTTGVAVDADDGDVYADNVGSRRGVQRRRRADPAFRSGRAERRRRASRSTSVRAGGRVRRRARAKGGRGVRRRRCRRADRSTASYAQSLTPSSERLMRADRPAWR